MKDINEQIKSVEREITGGADMGAKVIYILALLGAAFAFIWIGYELAEWVNDVLSVNPFKE